MRQAEPRAVREFLDRAFAGPAGMVVEGEAGMGKTTFLWHVAEAAGIKGFRVLSTCGSPTEARYAYAAVADLLSAVDTAVLANRQRPSGRRWSGCFCSMVKAPQLTSGWLPPLSCQ